MRPLRHHDQVSDFDSNQVPGGTDGDDGGPRREPVPAILVGLRLGTAAPVDQGTAHVRIEARIRSSRNW